MAEEWRPVVGYEGIYEVSNRGRIKSLMRLASQRDQIRLLRERILRTHIDRLGYFAVGLTKDARQRHWYVHRIVALAFLGAPPFEGAEVNHIDGNKANPDASNLEWCSHAENMDHANRNGMLRRGEKVGIAVLSESTVLDIRQCKRAGVSRAAVCRMLSVKRTTLDNVWNDVTWRHVNG